MIKQYCDINRILHQLLATRMPQQNGVAKKMNNTQKEVGRKIIVEASLPKRLWANVVNTTFHTQNRIMIHKNHKKTPYELWHRKKSNVGYFHTFGLTYFIHNNGKNHPEAFDDRVDKGIFLGYSSTSKAFMILNKMNMVAEEYIHMVFDEPHFSSDVADDLAEKVDKLGNNDEIYKETEESHWAVDEAK